MVIEKDDLNRLEDRLTEAMQAGFSGVHERLDALNGRTRKNSEDIVQLRERVRGIAPKSHRGVMAGGIAGAAALVAEVVRFYFQK